MASWILPLENTVWSVMPAMAAWLRVVNSALMLSGARSAVRVSSALACSSSAAVPWAAESGRRVEPVACSEIVVQASAAVAKPPQGPDDSLGLAVADGGAGLAAADDGAGPAASGAEQAVSARGCQEGDDGQRACNILQDHVFGITFRLRLHRRARSGFRRPWRSFPSVRV